MEEKPEDNTHKYGGVHISEITHDQIDKVCRKLDMGKCELVDKILRFALEKFEIDSMTEIDPKGQINHVMTFTSSRIQK